MFKKNRNFDNNNRVQSTYLKRKLSEQQKKIIQSDSFLLLS